MTTDHYDLLDDDLRITKKTRRAAGNGTWIGGALSGHRFEALVFPAHAENPEWELGDSRISKLWIQRLADRETVFEWDRGPGIEAADELAATIADSWRADWRTTFTTTKGRFNVPSPCGSALAPCPQRRTNLAIEPLRRSGRPSQAFRLPASNIPVRPVSRSPS